MFTPIQFKTISLTTDRRSIPSIPHSIQTYSNEGNPFQLAHQYPPLSVRALLEVTQQFKTSLKSFHHDINQGHAIHEDLIKFTQFFTTELTHAAIRLVVEYEQSAILALQSDDANHAKIIHDLNSIKNPILTLLTSIQSIVPEQSDFINYRKSELLNAGTIRFAIPTTATLEDKEAAIVDLARAQIINTRGVAPFAELAQIVATALVQLTQLYTDHNLPQDEASKRKELQKRRLMDELPTIDLSNVQGAPLPSDLTAPTDQTSPAKPKNNSLPNQNRLSFKSFWDILFLLIKSGYFRDQPQELNLPIFAHKPDESYTGLDRPEDLLASINRIEALRRQAQHAG